MIINTIKGGSYDPTAATNLAGKHVKFSTGANITQISGLCPISLDYSHYDQIEVDIWNQDNTEQLASTGMEYIRLYPLADTSSDFYGIKMEIEEGMYLLMSGAYQSSGWKVQMEGEDDIPVGNIIIKFQGDVAVQDGTLNYILSNWGAVIEDA